jgi:polyhydroxybutyrate depolymerase
MITTLAFAIMLPCQGFPGRRQREELPRFEIMVNGVKREAFIFYPENKANKPLPLVFAFHGHGGNGTYMYRKMGLNKLMPEAISVCMTGLPTKSPRDPKGLKNGWQNFEGTDGNRDLKFFDATLALIKKSANVNAKQIFVTGHSNGGYFTYFVWKARPEVFKAIAPMAGSLTRSGMGSKPIPTLVISGVNDPIVKYEEQKASTEKMRLLNQCEDQPIDFAPGISQWNSKSGNPVVFYSYDGGHPFPKDAPDMVVKFFRMFTKS